MQITIFAAAARRVLHTYGFVAAPDAAGPCPGCAPIRAAVAAPRLYADEIGASPRCARRIAIASTCSVCVVTVGGRPAVEMISFQGDSIYRDDTLTCQHVGHCLRIMKQLKVEEES
jgi:hypothetical protein